MDGNELDELGTDELLAVLRERVGELPEGTFKEAWIRLDQIITDGGPECLPAPWE